MKTSRREFLGNTAKLSAAALLSQRLTTEGQTLNGSEAIGFVGGKFPTQEEIWRELVLTNDFGTRYTGTAAHRKYEMYLAEEFTKIGLAPEHLSYTLPRWDPKDMSIKAVAKDGTHKEVPVAAYWGYSGKTGPEGVTGELYYAGSIESMNLSGDMNGKVVVIDIPSEPWDLAKEYPKVWGVFNSTGEAVLPATLDLNSRTPRTPAFRGLIDNLKKGGAIALVLAWTGVSDGNAAYNNQPAGGKFLNFPALWVGRNAGLELKNLAGSGAKATVVMEAEIVPDAPTDTLIVTLPGVSSDEAIIVHTHTDGPNAAEENGPIALLALARYFSRLPQSARNRTIIFVLTTGHMAEAYTPSTAWIKQRPDIIKKAVGSMTIEHLGCREWADDATLANYKPTGQLDWAFAFCPQKGCADLMLKALQGSGAGKVAVLEPNGRWHGIGGPIYQAGVPEIGYIARPNYLWTAPPNGYIDKIDPKRMHEETRVFAKLIHLMDKEPKASISAGSVS
jgi:hypothetical protein